MKRAQSMAQAAWSRPSLRSWSCIGPRRRSSTAEMTHDVTEEPSESLSHRDASEPFLTTVEETMAVIETTELPVSSPEGRVESSDNHTSEITMEESMDTGAEDADDIMDHVKYQDRMTEVELWQQIERELYEQAESEDVREIREEEEAAIAEVSDAQTQSSIPNTKEVHRFFPAGRILHIVTLITSNETDQENDGSSSSDSEHSEEEETEVAIFLTPRSLYSKLRLSQTMIADHFMPVYRRQIEKLIRIHENEGVSDTCDRGEEIH